MKEKTKFPSYIMEYLRQREGLKKDDTSIDILINQMNSFNAFDNVLRWNGIIGYAYQIIGWLQDCGYIVEVKGE